MAADYGQNSAQNKYFFMDLRELEDLKKNRVPKTPNGLFSTSTGQISVEETDLGGST